MVKILGMSFGFTGGSAKILYGFMIFVELTMAFGHRSLNIVGDINKFNQLLITNYHLS